MASPAQANALTYDEIQRKKYELWAEPADARLESAAPEVRLVAEGDSWFDYPPGLDILDNLKDSFNYEIHKLSNAGDTLENMVYGTKFLDNYNPVSPQINETLAAIKKYQPRAVLFSAGGNDIAGYELEGYLNHRDSGMSPVRDDYAKFMFGTVFKTAYEDFFKAVWATDPTVHIIGHGYGRAIPDGRAVHILGIRFSGPWLRPAFAQKRIQSPADARSVMAKLMDTFNDMLASLALKHDRFHYIDLRDQIKDADWVNELHLSNDAYLHVAKRFDDVIKALP